MDQVCHNHEPVMITRQSADAVVMISLEDYNSLQETAYLLSSPKNVKRLMESIGAVKTGKAKRRKLIDE